MHSNRHMETTLKSHQDVLVEAFPPQHTLMIPLRVLHVHCMVQHYSNTHVVDITILTCLCFWSHGTFQTIPVKDVNGSITFLENNDNASINTISHNC